VDQKSPDIFSATFTTILEQYAPADVIFEKDGAIFTIAQMQDEIAAHTEIAKQYVATILRTGFGVHAREARTMAILEGWSKDHG
jgi:hypothetical protein